MNNYNGKKYEPPSQKANFQTYFVAKVPGVAEWYLSEQETKTYANRLKELGVIVNPKESVKATDNENQCVQMLPSTPKNADGKYKVIPFTTMKNLEAILKKP